eukprot:5068887-Karenia_brevis.AAC.1
MADSNMTPAELRGRPQEPGTSSKEPMAPSASAAARASYAAFAGVGQEKDLLKRAKGLNDSDSSGDKPDPKRPNTGEQLIVYAPPGLA